MISGVELNPGLTMHSTSLIESTNAHAAPDINESLLKILNELTTFKNEQILTNLKIDNLYSILFNRLNTLESILRDYDLQLARNL